MGPGGRCTGGSDPVCCFTASLLICTQKHGRLCRCHVAGAGGRGGIWEGDSGGVRFSMTLHRISNHLLFETWGTVSMPSALVGIPSEQNKHKLPSWSNYNKWY